ncbi:hypothetical protein AAHB47_29030 [Bacillus wiedmannii]
MVDDGKDIINLLKFLEAPNGDAALSCLEENHIDLAIVNIMMLISVNMQLCIFTDNIVCYLFLSLLNYR